MALEKATPDQMDAIAPSTSSGACPRPGYIQWCISSQANGCHCQNVTALDKDGTLNSSFALDIQHQNDDVYCINSCNFGAKEV